MNMEKTIIEELKPIIREMKCFPTAKELVNIKRKTLKNLISKHGGLNYFRELLGDEPAQKPHGFWNSKTVFNEITIVIKEVGYLPNARELSDMGKGGLAIAITKNGGFIKFRMASKNLIKNREIKWR